MRLGLFLTVGVLIQAYFTATISRRFFSKFSIAGFFNIKFPDTLPEWLTKLFTTGYNGIAFWQILQVTAILLVIVEYMQYDRMLKEKDQKPNATSQAVFLIIAIALVINGISANYTENKRNEDIKKWSVELKLSNIRQHKIGTPTTPTGPKQQAKPSNTKAK